MNFFDRTQNTAGGIVENVFGYAATWEPSDNSEIQSATVLYKDATEKEGLSNVDFNIERYIMEYRIKNFIGLKASVDAGYSEKVKIETSPGIVLEFFVRRMETKFDGKTVIAILNPPESE